MDRRIVAYATLDGKIAIARIYQNGIYSYDSEGGVQIDRLDIGTVLEVQTCNSLYTIEVLDNKKFSVQGGSRFIHPCETWIGGSTWGGSMIKIKWIGIGMHIEMGHPNPEKSILLTSPV